MAAAGNRGSADVTFPAGEPGVVGVTGTNESDGRYGWASYGSWVTLAAPGCSPSTQAGGSYADFCGTSSAAAFASGIAALARSAARDASVEQVVAAMSANAVRVGDFVAAGRVDAAATTTVLSASCCRHSVEGEVLPTVPATRESRAAPWPGLNRSPRLGRLASSSTCRRAPAPPLQFRGRSPVAQLAEHSAVNRRVVGSSPTRGAEGRAACGKRMVTGDRRHGNAVRAQTVLSSVLSSKFRRFARVMLAGVRVPDSAVAGLVADPAGRKSAVRPSCGHEGKTEHPSLTTHPTSKRRGTNVHARSFDSPAHARDRFGRRLCSQRQAAPPLLPPRIVLTATRCSTRRRRRRKKPLRVFTATRCSTRRKHR